MKKGDVFVTSGAGGYYPPGIAVAIVTQLTDDGALARIISDPAATDFVAVEPIFEPQALVAAEVPEEDALPPADADDADAGETAPQTAPPISSPATPAE